MSKRKSTHHGVVLVDKPLGMTSTDVVRRIRRIMNTGRVGHAGTLDPDASGLLLVCVGEATKIVPFLMGGSKTYQCRAQLGTETQTDDAAGDPIRTAEWAHVSESALIQLLPGFLGEVQQTPPRVSALKHQGKRLHDLVRSGEDVDALLTPRPVTCHNLALNGFTPPSFELSMTVGKGFYVRSLVRDIGQRLDSAAHVTQLRRTHIGNFSVTNALSLDDISPDSLIGLQAALVDLPLVEADKETTQRFIHGQRVPRTTEGLTSPSNLMPNQIVRIQDSENRIIAVAELQENDVFSVVRGFNPH